MAMLAAPRRKQKVINLRAKNNAWSNDSTKFGQRMLEKMGWSSGKGLGAKENGIVEHVVARYKNDDKGLGFEDKNDQWTKHEDDFNALLANLSNADGTEEKLHSGVSLEVKSKKSKARVHYHKYTRGKDLTRYSEKDLANIFGKKTLKEEEKPVESIQEDIKSTEQVFTEKGSMEDYFKSKLAKFKSQSNLFSSKNDSGDNAEYAFKGFANNADENDEENGNQETHQGFGFSFYNTSIKETDNVNSNSNEVSETVEETQKVKKKKKKNKNKQDLVESNCENDVLAENTNVVGSCEQDDVFDEPNPDKKSKKKKKLKEEPLEDIQPDKLKPKKKSKVNKDSSTHDSMQDTQDVEEENYVPKKKKKRKNKDK